MQVIEDILTANIEFSNYLLRCKAQYSDPRT